MTALRLRFAPRTSLQLRGLSKWPSDVVGGDGIDVTKVGNIVTVSLQAGIIPNSKLADMGSLTIKGNNEATSGPPEDLTAAEVRVMLGLTPLVLDGQRVITASGAVTAASTNTVIAFNKTIAEITTLTLGNVSARAEVELSIEDIKGDADTYPITIVPSATDISAGRLIDGLASFQIANAYGFVTLRPYAGVGWKIVNSA